MVRGLLFLPKVSFGRGKMPKKQAGIEADKQRCGAFCGLLAVPVESIIANISVKKQGNLV